MRRRALLPLLIALVLPAGAAHAAVPGVAVDLTWGISHRDTDREIGRLQDAGVKWVRITLNWAEMEPKRADRQNPYVRDYADYAARRLREAGIRALLTISDGVPYWASADPTRRSVDKRKQWRHAYRPRRFSDYGDFVGWAVARYAKAGVHHFEIWNEPNITRFWPSGPDPAEYTQMLRAGAQAARRADPHATVLLGGLSTNDASYLEGLYEAGARRWFDVVAVHPYTLQSPTKCWNGPDGHRAADSFCGLEEIHRVMTAHGDGDKPVWATEMGWSDARAQGGVSADEQAQRLRDAFAVLRSYGFVTRAFWWTFRDLYWMHDDPDNLSARFGLLRTDFSAKPAFAALRDIAGGSQPPPQPPPPPSPPPQKPLCTVLPQLCP